MMKKFIAISTLLLSGICVADYQAPSQLPPNGLDVLDVPQFVAFGFDDNGLSGHSELGVAGGMNWVIELFNKTRNFDGGNQGTFDGNKANASFYLLCGYANELNREPVDKVIEIWNKAKESGFEIGNHSYSHPYGATFNLANWYAEINKCHDFLRSEEGLALKQIDGFRTPHLSYNNHSLAVLKQLGYRYDTSITEGWQIDQDGSNYFWPYTLDHGSPGEEFLSAAFQLNKDLADVDGLWSLHVTPFVLPPDSEMQRFGLDYSLRYKVYEQMQNFPYYDPRNGKIPGLDTSLFVDAGLNSQEALATMIYTFELRKQGNRAPLIFVAHSDVYSDNYGFDINTTAQQRRQVLADFVRYLSQQDEARMVSNTQLVDWLNDPISLSGKVTNGVKPTTHSALVTQRDCNALPWQKNARYGSAQQVSYQGNRWYSIWTHENLEPGVDAVWLNLGRCGTQFQASNVIATTKRLELEPGSMWQGSNNTGTVAGFSEVLISINGEGIISPSQGNIYPIGSELPLEMVANEGHYLKNAWLDGEILTTLDAIKLVNPKHELRLDFAQMPNNVCRSPKWENGNSYRSGERVNINNQEYQALYWNQSSPLSRDHTLWLEVGECLSH